MAEYVKIAALVVAAAALSKALLMKLRNDRGLYDWPRWLQALICIADGIPLSAVGQFPNQAAFVRAMREAA